MPSRRTRFARPALVLAGLAAASAGCSSAPTRESWADETVPAATPPSATTPSATATAPPPAPAPGVPEDAGNPDAGDGCKRAAPGNACGVAPQCGCTLAETCDVLDSAGNVGCIVAGKAPMGHPCTTTAGCALGLTCAYGTCHAFCGNAGGACTTAGTTSCVQLSAAGGVAIPNLAVCLVGCDLRSPTACGGTTAAGTGVCQVDDQGKTDCQSGGTRTVGQSCSPTDDCGPALVCVLNAGSTTAGTCRKWCRVGTPDCGGSAVCGGFQTKIDVGTPPVEYGACP